MTLRSAALAGTLICLAPRALSAAPQAPAVHLEPGAPALADQRYATGRQLYASNDLAGALAEFQVADSLFPGSAKLTFNLARVHERLAHWSEALTYYQRYLSLAPQAEDAADVRAIVAVLQARVAQAEAAALGAIRVDCDVPGEPVAMDDRPDRRTCGSTWTGLPAGSHTVHLHLDPFPATHTTAEVAVGQTTVTSLLPTPRLTLTTKAPVAEVRLNGYSITPLPVVARPVPPGLVQVDAIDQDGRPGQASLTLSPGENRTFDLEFVAPETRPRPVWPAWAMGTGGVLLAAGLGLLAYHEVRNGDGLASDTHDVLKILVPALSFTGGAVLATGVFGFVFGETE